MNFKNYLIISLTETILTDKRVVDRTDDEDRLITTHYQSLYLHLKALSQQYTLLNDTNKARRIMTLAKELSAILDRNTEVRFRK